MRTPTVTNSGKIPRTLESSSGAPNSECGEIPHTAESSREIQGANTCGFFHLANLRVFLRCHRFAQEDKKGERDGIELNAGALTRPAGRASTSPDEGRGVSGKADAYLEF